MEYTLPLMTSARRIFIASRNYLKESLWTIIVIDQHSTQLKIIFVQIQCLEQKKHLFVSKPCQQNLTPQANLSVTYSDRGLNFTVYK